MARIVILGAGIGGVAMAYEMREMARKCDQVTIISKGDSFHFTPSIPWIAAGWRSRDDIELSLTRYLSKKGIDVITTGAKRLHPAKSAIELEDGRVVSYDVLVIATGSELAFDEVEGLGPVSGYTESICHIDHADRTKEQWQQLLDDPGRIVVGAVQGASCLGPAYEFAMILDGELRRRARRERVPITFVTPEPYIGHLGLGGVGDTKGLLESELRQHDIKWITNARVDRIEAGLIHVTKLRPGGGERMKDTLPFEFGMILPGLRGVAAIRNIEGLTNPRGFVLVDQHQRNPRYPNIFAIGGCVAVPPFERTPVPVGTPITGMLIESMVRATTYNIRDLTDGREPCYVATWNAMGLADFGDRGVAFIARPQLPPRDTNWSASGKWVHQAKVGFERSFLQKVKRGATEPYFERLAVRLMGMKSIRQRAA